MSQLTLHFLGNEKGIVLQQTEFSDPALPDALHCIRGTLSGPQHGCFPWSSAVKGLCLLCLETKLNGEDARLSGERGSPASSLDYALSKKPSWLLDMFGIDSRGESISRRLVQRINPERKYPGPVHLYFRKERLSRDRIVISLDAEQLDDPNEIGSLAAALLKEWNPQYRSKKAEDDAPNSEASNDIEPALLLFDKRVSQAELAKWYRTEIVSVLSRVGVFSPHALKAAHDTIVSHPVIQQVAPGIRRMLSETEFKMETGRRLALADRAAAAETLRRLLKDQAINVSLSVLSVGTYALLQHLSRMHRIPLKFDFSMDNTNELVAAMVSNSPGVQIDLCAIGLPASARFLASKARNYVPLFFAPHNSQRIIRAPGSLTPDPAAAARYVMIPERPTNRLLVLFDMYQAGMLPQRALRPSAFSDEEACRMLFESRGEEVRTALAFPHYRLAVEHGGCSYVRVPTVPTDHHGIIFVHRRIVRDKHLICALDILIRDAWLSLIENPDLIDPLAAEMVANVPYLKAIAKSSGGFVACTE